MGRFVHEAVAINPATGMGYRTEDARRAGLYRFLPRRGAEPRAGWRTGMLAVAGKPRFDTRKSQSAGVTYPISWVPIEQPDRAHATERAEGGGVFEQGWERGGAVFARLEGAWSGGGKVYVTATSGGDADMGQVWELDVSKQTIRLLYESPNAGVLNMPDNICVSPRGGLVLCEDGTQSPCVRGLTTDGQLFTFVRNNVLLAGETRAVSPELFVRANFPGRPGVPMASGCS